MAIICILVGIVPPDLKLWELVKQSITAIPSSSTDDEKNISIDWRDASAVKDEGVQTLVVEGIVKGSSSPDTNAIVQLIASKFQEYGNNHSVTSSSRDGGDENEELLTTSFSCELWATSPAPMPLQPSTGYNHILKWKNNNSQDTNSWIDWGTQTMKEWGMLVQEKILNEDQIKELSSYVTAAINQAELAIQTCHPEIEIGKDIFFYKEIASRNIQRFDLRLTNTEVITFVQQHILDYPIISSLLEKTLGTKSEIDFDVSVVYSRPNACVQGWHADGSHIKGANDAGWEEDGWKTQLADAYAICLFIPLIDLNYDVGYTQFWPASHRSSRNIGFGPLAEITKCTFNGICQAGDCIWYDYRLIHRGMPNTSDRIRPVLQVIFKKKWYIEKANYGTESIIK